MKSPHVIVVSADGNDLIGSVNGADAKSSSGHADLKAATNAYLEEGTLIEQPQVLKWYVNDKGYSRQLPFVGITDNGIITSEGKRQRVTAFSELQPGGVKFAKRYVDVMEQRNFAKELSALRETFTYPESEAWTSSAGKVIDAQFVALNGDQVDLSVDKVGYAKKKYSFSLDKLNEESQEKAKKWQEILAKQKAEEEALKEELR